MRTTTWMHSLNSTERVSGASAELADKPSSRLGQFDDALARGLVALRALGRVPLDVAR